MLIDQVTIGTPGQPVALQLDTGSSDLWVYSYNGTICQTSTEPCKASGTYKNNASSTYRYVNSDFYIRYGSFVYASGDYGIENFQIGGKFPLRFILKLGAQINHLQFGIAFNGNATVAVMGIGYPSTEAIVLPPTYGAPYPNLIDEMFAQGIVASRTYSLYLNDIDASTGTILFGGIDLKRFTGTLHTFPLNKGSSGEVSAFWITLTGISITPPLGSLVTIGASIDYPFNVLLDSGTTFILLPAVIVTAIAAEFGAELDPGASGLYILPNCSSQFAHGSITFTFSGFKIRVPYSEFVLSVQGICYLGMLASSISGGCGVLGDTFLRSAYVVYDLVSPCSSDLILGQ